MKKIALVWLVCVSGAFAGQTLNCHTDAKNISAEKLMSFDLSASLSDSGLVLPGGTLYINTFPPHPVDPNPFLKVETRDMEIRDSLLGAKGQLILYFKAGKENYVLDVKKQGPGKLAGVLRRHGNPRLSVEARCYQFPVMP